MDITTGFILPICLGSLGGFIALLIGGILGYFTNRPKDQTQWQDYYEYHRRKEDQTEDKEDMQQE